MELTGPASPPGSRGRDVKGCITGIGNCHFTHGKLFEKVVGHAAEPVF